MVNDFFLFFSLYLGNLLSCCCTLPWSVLQNPSQLVSRVPRNTLLKEVEFAQQREKSFVTSACNRYLTLLLLLPLKLKRWLRAPHLLSPRYLHRWYPAMSKAGGRYTSRQLRCLRRNIPKLISRGESLAKVAKIYANSKLKLDVISMSKTPLYISSRSRLNV